MIELENKGDWKDTRKFLNKLQSGDIFSDFDKYGQTGVRALSKSTPIDTGLASSSWEYRIIRDRDFPGIEWYNTDVEGGAEVVILIQYGHGTRNGGWVQGRDFINPTMRPIFDQIADDVWKKVKI